MKTEDDSIPYDGHIRISDTKLIFELKKNLEFGEYRLDISLVDKGLTEKIRHIYLWLKRRKLSRLTQVTIYLRNLRKKQYFQER